ncbi:metal-dependent hydrolase [Halarchaeum salinum]|uniref:Metal-dependent hydrolase n=1 Tax=Halarchaeum salinum TaxID=489912 RepID=A0AAV3S6N7_9EURY
MVTTHAAMGAALVTLLPLSPRFAAVTALAAFLGGVFPDLDLLVGEHRRTLHYPDYYALGLVPCLSLAALRPLTLTVVLAAFVGSAALHSVADAFGGGLAPRPWLRDDHRGVYCRLGRRWLHPRHWVRWDGAPEDLALCGVCVCAVLLGAEGPIRALAVATLPVSIAYTALRKRLPELAPWLVE